MLAGQVESLPGIIGLPVSRRADCVKIFELKV
jgi:hypothetical protein